MANLYSIYETSADEILKQSQSIKKVDVIFDLKRGYFTNLNSEFDKNIRCVCGSCDLSMEKNEETEVVTLNNHEITIRVKKNINVKLTNCTADLKVVIEYL